MSEEYDERAEEFHLPLELKTVLKSVRRKWYLLLLLAVLAAGAGYEAALEFGSKTYAAVTVLAYQPIESIVSDTFQIFQTMGEGTELSYAQGAGVVRLSDSDKSLSNQIHRVKLPSNLEQLRQELQLEMTIDAVGSAVDVDTEGNTNLMIISAEANTAELASSMANTLRDIYLEQADEIIAENLQQNMDSLKAQYEVSKGMLDDVRTEFRAYVEQYKITNIDFAIQRISEELIGLELSLPRIAEEIDYNKQQIAALEASIGKDSGADSYLVPLVKKKINDHQLALIEAEGTYASDKKRYDQLYGQYENLPEIKQQYTILSGQLATLEAETKGLEKVLSQYDLLSADVYSDFAIISEAVPPSLPMSSNRKLIAVAVAGVIFIFGFMLILLLIITDTRLRSAGDARQKLQEPVLKEFPYEKHQGILLPGSDGREAKHIETYRILARSLRMKLPDTGGTLLITSTTAGEGKTTAAINLAAVYGRQDQRVLLIDAQVRSGAKPKLLHNLIAEDEADEAMGLGEYLSYKAFDPEEIISRTWLPGVDIITGSQEAVIPDLLQSQRMAELVTQLKETYSIIIFEGAPVGESVDSEIIAQYCDYWVMTAACGRERPDSIRAALKRMKQEPILFAGIILTKVRKTFRDTAL